MSQANYEKYDKQEAQVGLYRSPEYHQQTCNVFL